MWAVQAIFENAVPLNDVGVIRDAVLGLNVRSRVAAADKRNRDVGFRFLLAFDRRDFGERKGWRVSW